MIQLWVIVVVDQLPAGVCLTKFGHSVLVYCLTLLVIGLLLVFYSSLEVRYFSWLLEISQRVSLPPKQNGIGNISWSIPIPWAQQRMFIGLHYYCWHLACLLQTSKWKHLLLADCYLALLTHPECDLPYLGGPCLPSEDVLDQYHIHIKYIAFWLDSVSFSTTHSSQCHSWL